MDALDLTPFVEAIGVRFREGDPAAADKNAEAAHVEAVECLFGHLGRGHVAAFLESFTDDVEFEMHAPAEFPFRRRARGRAELGTLVEHNFAAIASDRAAVSSVVAQGNLVVLTGRDAGTLRASGAAYDVQLVYEFTLHGGRIRRVREFIVPTSA
jgi:uncharacterized protein